MAQIHAHIDTAHYRTEIRTGSHLVIADEPVAAGGEDLGFSPEELLAASLGACTSATLRMYADRKGWTELREVKVSVSLERSSEQTAVNRLIELVGDLSQEQKDRLLYIANRCPIHQALSHPVHIETTLE